MEGRGPFLVPNTLQLLQEKKKGKMKKERKQGGGLSLIQT